MKPPPLTYIRSFECAARHLSFTAAAQELGLTQPAISTHIRALEQHIGRQLFIRYARSLKLTEMGEAFLPTLRQALDQIDNATASIVASARKRTVVVACPISLAENWLAACVAEFRRMRPEIEVVLHGTIWKDEGESIADVTISLCRYDHQPAAATMLWQDQLALFCAPRLLPRLRQPSDLLAVERIFVHARQDYWKAVSTALGVELPDGEKGLATNASNIALELAAAGAGCIATQLSLARTYVERGLLVEPFAIRTPSSWNYYLSESPTAKGTVARVVREWILARASADFGPHPGNS